MPDPYTSATGDGTTDDTAAFQALAALNGVLFLPEGTYRFTQPLVFDGNIKIIGANKDTTILLFDYNIIIDSKAINLKSSKSLIDNITVKKM